MQPCKVSRYCSVDCQRRDWKAKHKKGECKRQNQERDFCTAMLEKELAAGDKNATNIFILATRFALELGDPKYAVELYKKATEIQTPIEGGHPVAMLHLAVHYEQGTGTERDYAQAFYWYNRVIQHPFPGEETAQPALAALSHFYKEGLGDVEKSSEMATKYLAFSQSDPETLEEMKQLETWWETTGRNLDLSMLTGR